MGIWVVPDSQVHILSLPYQEHVFRLFHERLANRISHYIGIPMAVATLYAALSPPFAVAVAAGITTVHLALAIRHRLWALCAVVVGAQALIGLFAAYVLAPFYATHTGFPASPWLHIFGWSFLQYVTHALESKFPEPWGTRTMTSRDEWFRHADARHFLLVLLAVGPHVFVEWFSGFRNLFLLCVRLARCFGYRHHRLKKMDDDLRRVRMRCEPVLRYAHFEEEISR
jgi:hypothetical protein